MNLLHWNVDFLKKITVEPEKSLKNLCSKEDPVSDLTIMITDTQNKQIKNDFSYFFIALNRLIFFFFIRVKQPQQD